MKKRKIVWTKFAIKCLDEIYGYIEDESGSITVASKYLQKLVSSVEHLSSFPESGTTEPLLKKIGQNSRYIVMDSYKIIYQFDTETIFITDLFHTKQQPKKIVKRNRKADK